MGLLSFLFSTDNSKKIENSKQSIENFKKNIEIIKKNTKSKTQAHYHESAKKNISTLQYLIKKENEKIKELRKKK